MLNTNVLTGSETTFGPQTLDMKYGIENESKAVAIYSSQTGN